MVSSGRVNSDLGSLKSSFTQYNGFISELSSFWKGPSYDNLVAKSNEFSSSYLSSMESQMNSFATACDLYENYISTKNSISVAQQNYNTASSNNDSSAKSRYSSEISELKAKLESLKSQIESSLQAVCSIKLENSSVNANAALATNTTTLSNSQYVQGAIDWACAVAADNSHGYSQSTRWGNPNYDCSSLVISAYENAGIPVKEAGAGYTGNMRSAFTKCGFTWIPGQPKMEDLLPGDVLLSESDHTEMYIGNGQNVGAHSNYDGANGDSSGREINISKYSKHHWDGVLRYVGQNNNNNSDNNGNN